MADPKPEYGPGQEPTVGKSPAQQRAEYLAALRAERSGYEQRGLTDRVKDVDEAIKRLVGDAKPAAKATRAPVAKD